MGCILSYLTEISSDAAQQKLFTESLLAVLSDYQKVDRITLCFFKMADQLLANTNFETYILENK